MERERIRDILLANGFKTREQEDGSIDLNPYVYTAIEALLAEYRETVKRDLFKDDLVDGLFEIFEPQLTALQEVEDYLLPGNVLAAILGEGSLKVIVGELLAVTFTADPANCQNNVGPAMTIVDVSDVYGQMRNVHPYNLHPKISAHQLCVEKLLGCGMRLVNLTDTLGPRAVLDIDHPDGLLLTLTVEMHKEF